MVDTDGYLDKLADQHWGDDLTIVEDHRCSSCGHVEDFEVNEEGEGACSECGHVEYFQEHDNDIESYYYEDQRD